MRITRKRATGKTAIREPAVARSERDLPLSEDDERRLRDWLHEINRARRHRLEKLERIALLVASLPPELGEAAVIRLAEDAHQVLAACRADDPEQRTPLHRWAESVELAWESDGGLLRASDHPDVR